MMLPQRLMMLLGCGLLAVLSLTFGAGIFAPLMAMVALGIMGYLAFASESHRREIEELGRLRAAYDQLDQQAKLIIRTDLELHRTQEELDRRLASLMSLYQLSRELQVNIRPEEVFRKLDANILTNFGFTKGAIAICPALDQMQWSSIVGMPPEAAEKLQDHIVASGLLKQIVTHPTPRILREISATQPAERAVLEIVDAPAVVIAGILPQAGPAGLLVLGRSGVAAQSRADEELVAILTSYLAIALENSALYEESWASRTELERKVQERTKQLADANDQLVRMDKAKSDWVSAVSHELRTPLAAIKGYASLLNTGQFGPLAKPQGERISKIEKHADLLATFINNLLDIARIESGKVTMEPRRIPVEEFLTSVQDVVQPQMQAKKLKFSVERDGVKELYGDSQHLQRVFVNLLSNAIKYTPEAGTITMAMTREGGRVRASVTDSGCGIGPEDLTKLFQEFYRANDPINQEVKGTGLGLALVKRIVEAHRGEITVVSEKGKGSTFSVSLPETAPETA